MSFARVFFVNATATNEIYTLSLHDALPISTHPRPIGQRCHFKRVVDRAVTLVYNHRVRSWIGKALGQSANIRDILQLATGRSEEHTSELQSHSDLVCRLLLEKKKVVNTT